MQLSLFDDGRIVINLDGRCNNTSSSYEPVTTVIGVYAAGQPIPAESDFSAGVTATPDPSCFEEFTGPGPVGTNSPDPNFDLASTTLTFMPISPGWVVFADPLLCAGNSVVGSGCGGLSLAGGSDPVLGGTWLVSLGGITAPAPFPNFMAIGNAIPAVPIGLILPNLFGPNCTAVQDLAFGLYDVGAASGGIATLNLPTPLSPTLAGVTLTLQGMSFNFPGPGPTFNLSNGVTGTLGF